MNKNSLFYKHNWDAFFNAAMAAGLQTWGAYSSQGTKYGTRER